MVNTFLPYSNIKKSLKSLDWKRLGKQRVEAKQILGMLMTIEKLCKEFPEASYNKFMTNSTLEFNTQEHDRDAEYIFERMKSFKETVTFFRKKTGKKFGFFSHCVTVMWVGYTDFLKKYINICVRLWIKKGYKNTMEMYENVPYKNIEKPWWFGYEKIHMSHRSSLYNKNKEYYRPLFGSLTFKGYIWPSHFDVETIKKVLKQIERSKPNDRFSEDYTDKFKLDKRGYVKIFFKD